MMNEMLTAKEMQSLLQVDLSTIYRMAEAGRLPAIKVGKQWRFPAAKVDSWFQKQITVDSLNQTGNSTFANNAQVGSLASILPLDCVQLIQDTFADILGVMLVVTDMQGRPITRPSHACGLFQAISNEPQALEKCIQSWQGLATAIDLEPQFSLSHLGLLCARALIPVGPELKGMVVAGCVAPESWPPSKNEIEKMAVEFELNTESLSPYVDEIFYLEKGEKQRVLAYLQRIANIVAHIVDERKTLVGRLAAIADLTEL
jgi:excisionase family DNA binding protein